MAVTSREPSQDNPTDRFPLLMERAEHRESNELVIDIKSSGDPSSSGSSNINSPGLNAPQDEGRPSTSGVVPIAQSPSSASNRSNSRSSSFTRRGEGLGRRWSPFNTTFWISIELVFTLGQIIAAIVVLSLSRHEKPKTPLFAWVVGYAGGCVASLPLLYWRYLHRNQVAERRSTQHHQGSSGVDSTPESNSYITISLTRTSDEGGGRNTSTGTWNGQNVRMVNARLGALADHFKMALDCFFAVWFVVGNVWIFGGHTSSSDAPNLYRLCIVFLTFSCIGYAMPFILCAMICCCLPCIISFLGVREDMNGMRGASEESINALPTYKFKLKRTGSGSSRGSGSEFEEGGLVAVGTEKERAISGEDAACCICLARYVDNDELRELPCSHFFHTECVDKWLKINASCPLCKYEIGDANENSPSPADSNPQA